MAFLRNRPGPRRSRALRRFAPRTRLRLAHTRIARNARFARISRSGEHNAPLIRFAHEPPLAAASVIARYARKVRARFRFAGLRCANLRSRVHFNGVFIPARGALRFSARPARAGKTSTGRYIILTRTCFYPCERE